MTSRALRSRIALYALNFIFTLQLAGAMYFNTTFLLSRHIGAAEVGVVFALTFLMTAVFMLYAPHLVRTFGNLTVFVTTSLVTAILSYLLAYTAHPSTAIALFMAISAFIMLLYFSLDVFLENVSADAKTGGIRAVFLTIGNSAFLIAPALVGFLIDWDNLNALYTFVALCMFALSLLSVFFLSSFKDPKYPIVHWPTTFASIRSNINLKRIFFAQFMLRFFYAIMVVYLPIHLIANFGFTFSQMGIIFSIMLIPFILLEIPLGRLGDRRLGEKEMLIGGFAFLFITTSLLPFVHSGSIFVWGFALFCTRVGAAMIDIGSESYFFKKITAQNTAEMSAFRILYPLAYGIGPIVGTITLLFVNLSQLFFVLALLMLVPLFYLIPLKDTR